MDDYGSDCEFDSYMEWTPQKPDPPFNPYLDQYIPGGWPADPPSRTSGVFARPQPPGLLLPAAKKVCRGLAVTSQVLVSVAAVPIYAVVRRVRRRQQQVRQARPQRPVRPETPTRVRAPLTESPWIRANAYHNARLAAMQTRVVLPHNPDTTDTQAEPIQPHADQVTGAATDESLPYITWITPRGLHDPSISRPHPPRPSRSSKKILYTIPDFMPKSTIRKKRSLIGRDKIPTRKQTSPASTKRKLDSALESTVPPQEIVLASETQAAIDGVSPASGFAAAKCRQARDPISTSMTLVQPSTDTKHGPSSRSLFKFISLFTNTRSAESNTQSHAPPNGLGSTSSTSNSSLQQTAAEGTLPTNNSPLISEQQIVKDIEITSPQASASPITDSQLVDYIQATHELNTSSTTSQQPADPQSETDTDTDSEVESKIARRAAARIVTPSTTQQLVGIKSTNALIAPPLDSLEQQGDIGFNSAQNTTCSKTSHLLVTTTTVPKPPTLPTSKSTTEPLISKSPDLNTGEYLTPPRIKHRRVEALSSARKSRQNLLVTQSPESDISSSCPFSPGNPGWDLPNLSGLHPPSETQTKSDSLNVTNAMQESTHHEKSRPNASVLHQCESITSHSSARVTGGGSPLSGSKSSIDLGQGVPLATSTPIDPSLLECPETLTVDENGAHSAGAREAKVIVTQPMGVLAPNSLSTKNDEAQMSGRETQQRDPGVQGSETETAHASIASNERELDDLFDPSRLSNSTIINDAPSKTPSISLPTTPEKQHLKKENSSSDPEKERRQLAESPLETPERGLAQLTLDDAFDPNTSTPKAGLHSDARGKRVTRAEAKRLQLLKEVQQYSIGPLDEEWESRIQNALKNGHDMYKATDLTRVVPLTAGRSTDNWLNDEVINGYLKLVTAHGKQNNRPMQTPTHHAFASFFYSNLSSKGYDSVKRWALKAKIGGKNLLETEQVFIPINSGMHWTLCVVSGKEKTITHYNSLGGNGQGYVNTVKNWVKTELGTHFVESEWVITARGESPQQANMDDCGVFAITNARQIMLGLDPTSYNASQIPLQRKRIVAELINGGLIKSKAQ